MGVLFAQARSDARADLRSGAKPGSRAATGRALAASALLAAVLLAAGCSSIGLSTDKVDYKTVAPQRALDLPPELAPLPANERYDYVFEGNAQTFHILVAAEPKSLAPLVGISSAIAPLKQ